MTTDPETGQTLISGMGELHLEIIVDRLVREFKVEANVGRPQVAYRETITRAHRARGDLRARDRRARPVSRRSSIQARSRAGAGEGVVCSRTRSPAAALPKEFIAAVERGVREALGRGVAGRLSGDRRRRSP